MIITEQKPFGEIIDSLKDYKRIFLVGCGECATTCKTGGKEELERLRQELERQGKVVTAAVIPDAPCIASQVKSELAKNMSSLRQADAILVMACGLGVQSVRENNRIALAVLPGCNSLFGATLDSQGNFCEKCSLCGECVLAETAGICPVTLCSKGLLNGPCGGANKGKCEVDPEKDCAWVMIYKELQAKDRLGQLRKIQQPKDHKKTIKPRKILAANNQA